MADQGGEVSAENSGLEPRNACSILGSRPKALTGDTQLSILAKPRRDRWFPPVQMAFISLSLLERRQRSRNSSCNQDRRWIAHTASKRYRNPSGHKHRCKLLNFATSYACEWQWRCTCSPRPRGYWSWSQNPRRGADRGAYQNWRQCRFAPRCAYRCNR